MSNTENKSDIAKTNYKKTNIYFEFISITTTTPQQAQPMDLLSLVMAVLIMLNSI